MLISVFNNNTVSYFAYGRNFCSFHISGVYIKVEDQPLDVELIYFLNNCRRRLIPGKVWQGCLFSGSIGACILRTPCKRIGQADSLAPAGSSRSGRGAASVWGHNPDILHFSEQGPILDRDHALYECETASTSKMVQLRKK